ncbi:MAG: PmoA family protein [Verrucomicrobia bacterium]|nr:PmoA family protein [Verrucomicrobiota bacterium]
MKRRAFLKCSLAGAAAPLAVRLYAATPAPGTDGLTTYQLGPRIWIRWNNRPLTCYRAHPSQKYPYLYPLAGPTTGLPLTTETSLPYPHHRSLFFGCDRVNGGNYWQEDYTRGQIVSAGPRLGQVTKTTAEILDACSWQKPGQPPVMKDQRRLLVTVVHERLQWVDCTIEWTALTEVQIQKTNHSLFAMRAAADLTPHGGGQLTNADGRTGEKATFGQPSAWCDFSGPRERIGGNPVEGIALLDHPQNPWAPCPWFTRDYGFASPTPLNFLPQPITWPPGKSVTLRYRVVLHAGDARDAGLGAIHREWIGQAR